MRRLVVGALVSAIGVVAALSTPAGAQAPSRAVSTGTSQKPYTTPKTPWGDPDISGTWSSDDLRNVPVQRPAEYGNRAELTDAEYAKRLAAAGEARDRELNRVGAFRNDVGTRTFRQTSLVVEPADGKLPVTAEAQKEVERRQQQRSNPPSSWTDRSLYDRCITRGVFGSVLPVIYGNGNFIFQSPGVVSITYEMVHDTRIIPLDGRPHISNGIRQYMGDARGHFEGDTLVVETTNFRGDERAGWLDVNGSPYTDALKMTERFRRPNFGTLEIDVTIDDAKAYTKPFTVRVNQRIMVDQEMIEFICNENERSTEHLAK
jgi:hypothetical protein